MKNRNDLLRRFCGMFWGLWSEVASDPQFSSQTKKSYLHGDFDPKRYDTRHNL